MSQTFNLNQTRPLEVKCQWMSVELAWRFALQYETSVNDCALCRDGNKLQLWRTDTGSMNPVSVSAEIHRQFPPKPKVAAARPTENENRPKLNFSLISAPKPKPKRKFGRPLIKMPTSVRLRIPISTNGWSTDCLVPYKVGRAYLQLKTRPMCKHWVCRLTLYTP